MFKFASNKLLTSAHSGSTSGRHLLDKLAKFIIKEPRAAYIKGFWPEPLTQQTLQKFLQDINYFEEPRKFVNIGLNTGKPNLKNITDQSAFEPPKPEASEVNNKVPDDGEHDSYASIDQVLDLLSEDAVIPSLNYDDVILHSNQLMRLAINCGIYRDLFGHYEPDRAHIHFTEEQAKNLDRLVPHHWITDQPFARVVRNQKESKPLNYFEPVVRISARFVQDNQADQETTAHTAYYGNIIPAAEANSKPSITLDCSDLPDHAADQLIRDSQFDNWTPGMVSLVNLSNPNRLYFTVAMLNLDSLHPDSANLHWMITNISPSKSPNKGAENYEEVCEYLPVHGICGFGYSRYVFLVLRHDTKLDLTKIKIQDFSLDSRKFDAKSFIEQHKAMNMLPVGLSWFQTTWDSSSNRVFHDYLQMRSPVYDYVQPKPEKKPINKSYPGKIPFHIFLDHERDPKEINEQVLLERLKIVDPYDYKDQYVPPKVPPTVFEEDGPSWMRTIWLKKKNKIGYWRGLRPASATLPLNNNADLDHPIRPIQSSELRPPGYHNLYPGKPKIKLLRNLPYSKPANEHESVYVQQNYEHYVDQAKEMMKKSATSELDESANSMKERAKKNQ